MTQKHLWHFLLIIFVVAWSMVELLPPRGHDMMLDFESRAQNKDAVYSNIVARAKELGQLDTNRTTYANLKRAIGTNDITKYFNIDASAQKDPSRYVLNRLQKDASGQIKLGLDLQGGTSFIVGLSTNNVSTNLNRQVALVNAVEVLRKRVDNLGVAEPLLQPTGADRILIQLPGLSEAAMDEARTLIEQAAFLEFRMVHEDSATLISQGIREPGYEILEEQSEAPDGTPVVRRYMVKRGAERGLNGSYITGASVQRHPITGNPEIHFQLNSSGAKLFAEITRQYKPQPGGKEYQLAIVLDGELQSAPVIRGEIPGGRGSITGQFTVQEALRLAYALENPLETPVEIIQESTVAPSLGEDTIKSGVNAAIAGTIAVGVFMLVYYLLAGAIANAALLLNLLILMGVLCMVDATLTMPGIAGVVLTVGIAVDANVLIFERIREELATGKSTRGAVSAGYDKAFGTILDTNLTTLIASVILAYMGTGPVKGFGITLSIGVSASMFTALLVTRLVFDFLLAQNFLSRLKMLRLVGKTRLDFMRFAKPAFVASWLLILVGAGYGFMRGKDVLGVEFAGGDKVVFAFNEKVEVDQIRATITTLNVGDPIIQYSKEVTGGAETLEVTTRLVDEAKAGGTAQRVVAAIKKEFPDAGFRKISSERVGGVVSREIQVAALVASLMAMFGILVYVAFRYEFSFAVGAIVAVMHDIMMTMGWFFLTGRELSAPMVAAILTIIGFSINDTIVVFDRIREDLRLGVRGTFKDVVNHALNQTLSRTLVTSATTLLATTSLYLFGGGVINDFAFTFLVGILTGTYSSIYIASAIVLWWHKGHRPPTLGAGVALENVEAART